MPEGNPGNGNRPKLIAVSGLVIMGIIMTVGIILSLGTRGDVPPGVGALTGTVIGYLAGLLTPRPQ